MQYYVYQLEDPGSGLPFYVGKGKGQRAWSHTDLVNRGRSSGNSRKDAKISELLSAGTEPVIRIVARYEYAEDAYEHEIDLIAATPGLLNIRRGGEGFRITPQEQDRLAKIRKIKVSHREWLRSRVKLRNWYNSIYSYPGEKSQDVLDWLEYVRGSLSRDIPSLESRLANI
jgi:hypothetical protein